MLTDKEKNLNAPAPVIEHILKHKKNNRADQY